MREMKEKSDPETTDRCKVRPRSRDRVSEEEERIKQEAFDGSELEEPWIGYLGRQVTK